jgi:hypothetical protein
MLYVPVVNDQQVSVLIQVQIIPCQQKIRFLPMRLEVPFGYLLLDFLCFYVVIDRASGKNHLRCFEGKAVSEMRRRIGLPVREVPIGNPSIPVVSGRS